jgi:hypothetical protein
MLLYVNAILEKAGAAARKGEEEKKTKNRFSK